ncbi:MAG: radical SAM protein [Ruminococcaceae bacterium]|nr:radical SAM protein [Oscillospiraceae bacterium]
MQQAYKKWKNSLANSAKKTKTPIMGQYELTGRCNLDCKMCYVHNIDAATCLKKELSTDEWKRIFDEAVNQELLFATLTGGECLLRPDFKELYLYLYKKGVKISVFTNGTLINDEYIRFFNAYKPERIQISLYGSNEESYLKVTGHRGFEKTVCAIKSLIAVGVNVDIVTTPNRYMADDYLNIIRFCKEEKLPITYGELLLIPNRDAPQKDDYYLSMDEVERLAKERAKLYKPLIPLDSTPEPWGPMTEPPEKGLTCSGGTCLACVTWDGIMVPCLNAMVGGVSLREKSYSEAWKSIVASAAGVLHGVECKGCPYDKVCPKCRALRLTGLDTGHCNTAVCELYRRLVASGVKKLDAIVEDSCEN